MINFYSEIDFHFVEKADEVRNWLTDLSGFHTFQIGELSYIFCDDAYLLRINQEYLAHDDYTDIITFDYTKNKVLGGDIFISIERVRDNAEQFHVAFEQELGRVLAHGLLHLIGFMDKTNDHAEEMRKQEEHALSMSSFPFR
jgi:probable rRNA maturation factor